MLTVEGQPLFPGEVTIESSDPLRRLSWGVLSLSMGPSPRRPLSQEKEGTRSEERGEEEGVKREERHREEEGT